MKKTKFLSLILLAGLSFSACQVLYFSEAQPRGVEAKSSMPAEMYGNYIALQAPGDDLLFAVNIHERGYIMYEKIDNTISRDSIEKDEQIYLQDSLIYLKKIDPNLGFAYKQAGDSISYSYYEWEEVLLEENKTVLKEDKGMYYLNILNEESEDPIAWTCIQLHQLKNGDLILWDIEVEQEQESIEKILKGEAIKEETKPDYLANPNRKQFRKFVKSGGFSSRMAFMHKLDENELPTVLVMQMQQKE